MPHDIECQDRKMIMELVNPIEMEKEAYKEDDGTILIYY